MPIQSFCNESVSCPFLCSLMVSVTVPLCFLCSGRQAGSISLLLCKNTQTWPQTPVGSFTVPRKGRLSWVFLTWDSSYACSEIVDNHGVSRELPYLYFWLLDWEGWNSWGLAQCLSLWLFHWASLDFFTEQSDFLCDGWLTALSIPRDQGTNLRLLLTKPWKSHSITSTTFC